MAEINIPNLYSGSADPLSLPALGSVKPTDPREYAITKTGSELGVDQYYFHTGDIAKLQSALFTQKVTGGAWANPDFAPGALQSNPVYQNDLTMIGTCHAGSTCAPFGVLSCDPANAMYIGNFQPRYNGVQCFGSFADLKNFIEVTLATPEFIASAGTNFITNEQDLVNIINTFAGSKDIIKEGRDSFLYTRDAIEGLVGQFTLHLSDTLDDAFAHAKVEMGISDSFLDAFNDGTTAYSGLLTNHRRLHQLSGEAVLKTGDQFVSGSKTFHNPTHIEDTGTIRYPIFGIGHTHTAQHFHHPSGIGNSILGGVNNTILEDPSSPIDTSSNVIWGSDNTISHLSGGAILGGSNNNIFYSNYGWIQNSKNSDIQNDSGNYIFAKHNNKISQSFDSIISGSERSSISSAIDSSIHNGAFSSISHSENSTISNNLTNFLARDNPVFAAKFANILSSKDSNISTKDRSENLSIIASSGSDISVEGSSNLILLGTRASITGYDIYSSLAAGTDSVVSGHQGAFVLSDSTPSNKKLSLGDDIIALYFKSGYISGGLGVGGNLTVEGDTDFKGDVNISGDLFVSGGFKGDTNFDFITINSGVTINKGDLTIKSGNLNLSGDINITGDIYQEGDQYINGNVEISGCLQANACIIPENTAALPLADGFHSRIIHYTPSTPTTVQLPNSVYPSGYNFTVMNMTSNEVSFTAAAGTSLSSFGTKITGEFEAATFYTDGSDWYGAGALSV